MIANFQRIFTRIKREKENMKRKVRKKERKKEMLYISTSAWVLPLQTLVEIVIFSIFHSKNLQKAKKKQEICSKIQQKNMIFEFAPKRWSKYTTLILKTNL